MPQVKKLTSVKKPVAKKIVKKEAVKKTVKSTVTKVVKAKPMAEKKVIVSKETSRPANARSKNISKKLDTSIVRVQPRTTNLSIPVYSLAGKQSGEMTLPKEIFGSNINKPLLAQAVRVYTTNQKNLLASTKTRGEIKASKAKIYRQKGTGKARHGAISAPIFVGGG